MAREDLPRPKNGLSKRQVAQDNARRRHLALTSDRPRNFIGEDGLDRFALGSLRLFLYERDAGQCQYCGIELPWSAAQYDHVLPHLHGGRTTPQNMVVACSTCNGLKENALIPERLRPDTSGNYEAWLKAWDGRNRFDVSDLWLRLGIPDDPDLYDPENAGACGMWTSDVVGRYRAGARLNDPEDDSLLYEGLEFEPS